MQQIGVPGASNNACVWGCGCLAAGAVAAVSAAASRTREQNLVYASPFPLRIIIIILTCPSLRR